MGCASECWLVDLIGPYYDLFNDAVQHSRHLSTTRDLGDPLSDNVPSMLHVNDIKTQKQSYHDRRQHICDSTTTSITLLALQDGCHDIRIRNQCLV